MKYLTIVLFFCSLFQMSCTAQKKNNTPVMKDAQQNENLNSITLTKQSRGSNVSYMLQGDYITYTNNGKIQKNELSTSDWNSLNDILHTLNLKKIKTYPSPTQNRLSDAASSSEISITTDQKNAYTSDSFDFGYPPKELAVLYNEIIRITNRFQPKSKPVLPQK